MKHLILILFSFCSMISCDYYRDFIKEIDYEKTVGKDFGYDLLEPDKKYFMGYSLEEISGLAYIREKELACIQDESGKLYIYNTKKKAVIQRIKFHKGGDYEGVEVIDRMAYVVKSNGDLFRVPLDDGDKPVVEKIKTPFSSKNNIEGLGYDALTGQLLFACKNDAGIKGRDVKGKAVYSFDPILEEVGDSILFTITKKDLKKFLVKMNRDDKEISFQPSAIAMHPLEDDYYVLASSGKALIVVSRSLEIKQYIRLRPAVFNQPEGICFSPDGDMYVSNEGDGEDGYILKFKYKK